jgi:hypothetical protein
MCEFCSSLQKKKDLETALKVFSSSFGPFSFNFEKNFRQYDRYCPKFFSKLKENSLQRPFGKNFQKPTSIEKPIPKRMNFLSIGLLEVG